MTKPSFDKKKKRKQMKGKSSVSEDNQTENIVEEEVKASQDEKLVEAAESAAVQEEKPETISISELQQEGFQKQAKELAEWKEKYMLLLAESENARKRLQKEKQAMIGYAVSNVVVDLIAPLDQMEKALGFAQEMSDEVRNWAMGFQMILGQFKNILSTHGVQPFEVTNGIFDPHQHEAVETVETNEHPNGTILEQLNRGYRMGERVIIPAKVKVARAPESVSQEPEQVALDEEKLEEKKD